MSQKEALQGQIRAAATRNSGVAEEPAEDDAPWEPVEMVPSDEVIPLKQEDAPAPRIRTQVLPGGSKALVGVDIGEARIKVVQVEKVPAGMTVTACAAASIPADSREGSKWREFVAGALREMFADGRFKSRTVICSAPKSMTTLSFMSLPSMSARNLQGALEVELSKSVPFELDSAIYDYTVLEAPEKEGIDVIAAVAEKRKINEFVDTVESAGLVIGDITIPAFAVENLMARSMRITKDKIVAILDVGFGTTNVSIFKGSRLHFTRSVGACGREFVKALMARAVVGDEAIELSADEAEDVLKNVDIIDPQDELVKDLIPASQLSTMVRPVTERLLSEVKRSRVYFGQVYKASKIDRLMLIGGPSRLKGLTGYLGGQLNVDTEIYDPFEEIAVSDRARDGLEDSAAPSDMAIALGLAVGGRECISLLSRDLKLRNSISRAKPYVYLGVRLSLITFALLLAVTYGWSRMISSSSLPTVKRSLESLNPQVAKYDEYDSLKSELARGRERLRLAAGTHPVWDGVMKELSHIVPNDIVLTELSAEEGTESRALVIEGLIYSQRKNRTLSEMMTAIKASPFFGEVLTWQIRPMMTMTKLDSNEPYGPQATFELKCTLVY